MQQSVFTFFKTHKAILNYVIYLTLTMPEQFYMNLISVGNITGIIIIYPS